MCFGIFASAKRNFELPLSVADHVAVQLCLAYDDLWQSTTPDENGSDELDPL